MIPGKTYFDEFNSGFYANPFTSSDEDNDGDEEGDEDSQEEEEEKEGEEEEEGGNGYSRKKLQQTRLGDGDDG